MRSMVFLLTSTSSSASFRDISESDIGLPIQFLSPFCDCCAHLQRIGFIEVTGQIANRIKDAFVFGFFCQQQDIIGRKSWGTLAGESPVSESKKRHLIPAAPFRLNPVGFYLLVAACRQDRPRSRTGPL
jgi:hypothetical protein